MRYARHVGGWVYIVTNKPHGVLYTGVTAHLPERTVQHRDKSGSKFARKYNATRLVYAEPHETIDEAIAREKAIKAWPRLWKLRLIQGMNPTWRDLFDDLTGA
jgi:putative endonuclease